MAKKFTLWDALEANLEAQDKIIPHVGKNLRAAERLEVLGNVEKNLRISIQKKYFPKSPVCATK